MNFGGLGFSFFASDKLTPVVKTAKAGIDGLWESFKTLSVGAKKVGGGIKKTLSFTGKQFGNLAKRGRGAISGMIGSVGSFAGSLTSPELDSAFSSLYAQFDKSFGQITAGMNLTEKESRKWKKAIGSSAHALNVDMSSTAEAWAAFERQGIKLNEVLGTKGTTQTIRRLIKVMDVMGLQGEQVAMITSNLTKGFNFTDKAAGEMMDRVFALGQHFNMGREAMQEYPAIIQSLTEEMYDFYKGAKPKDVEKLTISIMKLGGGLKESLGINAPEAMEKARSVFTKLVQNRRDIKKMFVGLGGEFGSFAQEVGMSTGDMHEMFEMMHQDPAKFMDRMHELTKTVKSRVGEQGTEYKRLIEVTQEAFGSDFVRAMRGNWEKGQKAMQGSTEALENAVGSLGKTAEKSFKTGRTRGEAFSLMVDSMKSRMHGLVSEDLNKWMKHQREGFKDFSKTLENVIEDDGPLAGLTKKFLMFQKVGISAFLPALKGMGPVLSQTLGQMTPMITAMGSMGINLGMVGKLLKPGGLIIGGLMLFNKEFREKVFGYVRKFSDYIQERFPHIVEEIKSSIGNVWRGLKSGFNDLFKWLGKNAGQIIDTTLNVFSIIGKEILNIIDSALPYIVSASKKTFTAIFGFLSKIDWGASIKRLMTTFGNVLQQSLRLVGSFVVKATEWLSSLDWERIGTSFVQGVFSVIRKAGMAISEFAGKLPEKINNLFEKLTPAIISFGKKLPGLIWEGLKLLGPMVWELAKSINKVAWSILKGVGKLLWEIAKELYKAAKEGLSKLWDIVWGSVKEFFGKIGSWIADKAKDIWGSVAGAAKGAWSSISGYASGAASSIQGAMSNTYKYIRGDTKKTEVSLSTSFGNILNTVSNTANNATGLWSLMGSNMNNITSNVANNTSDASRYMLDKTSQSSIGITSLWGTATGAINNSIGSWGEAAKGASEVISLANMEAAKSTISTWSDLASELKSKGLIGKQMAAAYEETAAHYKKKMWTEQKGIVGKIAGIGVASAKSFVDVDEAIKPEFRKFKAAQGASFSQKELSEIRNKLVMKAGKFHLQGMKARTAAMLAMNIIRTQAIPEIIRRKREKGLQSIGGEFRTGGVKPTKIDRSKPIKSDVGLDANVPDVSDMLASGDSKAIGELAKRIGELSSAVKEMSKGQVVVTLQPDLQKFFKVMQQRTNKRGARDIGGGR